MSDGRPARLTRAERARRAVPLAAQHDGVVHRRDLRAAGVDRADVRTEVAAGRWTLHGVHTVQIGTGPLSAEADRWRAVWESGSGAVLDGASALHAIGLTGYTTNLVEVTVPRANRRHEVAGVRSRRRRVLGPLTRVGVPRVRPEWAALRAAEWARTDREAVAEFHRLYRLSVRRWARQTRVPDRVMELRATLAEPMVKYEAVLGRLGDDCGIWLARHSGSVVGALVVLSHGSEHAYWRGAMDLELAGPVRANDLLQASAIEHACVGGADRYAMGLTAPGSGLARFKSGFGAEPRISHEYAIEPSWRSRLRRGAAPVLEPLREWVAGRAG